MKFDVNLDILFGVCIDYVQYTELFYETYGKGPHYLDPKVNYGKYRLYNDAYKAECELAGMESMLGIPIGISKKVYRISEKFWKRTSGDTLFPIEKVYASLIGGEQKWNTGWLPGRN